MDDFEGEEPEPVDDPTVAAEADNKAAADSDDDEAADDDGARDMIQDLPGVEEIRVKEIGADVAALNTELRALVSDAHAQALLILGNQSIRAFHLWTSLGV